MKGKESAELGRRDFLKTVGVVGGAAMLGLDPFRAVIAAAAVDPMDPATLAEQEKLYAAAKKEGELSFYQSSSTESGLALADAFTKKYPGVKCNVWRGVSVEVHTKYDIERRARKNICDVIHSSLYPEFLKMRDGGQLMTYASPEAKYYKPDWTDPEHFAPVRITAMAIGWNTDLVKDSEAPKTWAGSAEIAKEKKWFGKISIGDPSGGGTSLTQLYSFTSKWGDAAWEWYRIWGEADAGTFASHGAMDKEMLSGKYPLSLEQLDYRICEGKAKKEPINAWFPEEGVPMAPGPAAIIKEAPHPNAAKLFYNYFLSSEGCQAFQKGGYSNTGRKTGIIKWPNLPDPDKLNIIKVDFMQMEKEMKPLLEKFEKVFGEAKKRARAKA